MDHKTLADQFLADKNYDKYLYHLKQQYILTGKDDDNTNYKKAQKMKETYDELQQFLKIPKDDYYKILGVSKDDLSRLRDNYKKLCKKFHPDMSKIPECNEAFYRVQSAYAVLSNENKRREYDNRNRVNTNNVNYNMFFYEMARRRNVSSFDDFETMFRPEYYVYRRQRREEPVIEVEGLRGVVMIFIVFLFLFIAIL